MKPQSVIFAAIAATLLLFLFIGGELYVGRKPAANPPASVNATAAPDAPAIVEASPSPAAYPAAPAIPTPPSFGGATADAATDRVSAYLRWLSEIEMRRALALSQMMGSMQQSGFGIDPAAACQGKLPERPAPSPQDKEKIAHLQAEIAANRQRFAQLAQEAKGVTAPPELQRFHRPYAEFVQWNGDFLGAMADANMSVFTALERNDADAVCKSILRWTSSMQEMSQSDARAHRLLTDLNDELNAVRAQHPDLPENLRSFRIEMP